MMALIIQIMVNRHVLTSIAARRICGNDDPDSINTYEISCIDYRNDSKGKRKIYGNLKHRYGDNAETLTTKALEFIKSCDKDE